MAQRVAKAVERPCECPCQMLGGKAEAEVRFDHLPANEVADATDRPLVLNIAQIALSLHLGTIDAMGWHVENDPADKTITVVVRFPALTSFTLRQLELVELVNEVRIREVWVQPETDCVHICVTLWCSNATRTYTVQDLVVVHRMSEPPAVQPASGTRKRIRTR